jgi:hypothetical protein
LRLAERRKRQKGKGKKSESSKKSMFHRSPDVRRELTQGSPRGSGCVLESSFLVHGSGSSLPIGQPGGYAGWAAASGRAPEVLARVAAAAPQSGARHFNLATGKPATSRPKNTTRWRKAPALQSVICCGFGCSGSAPYGMGSNEEGAGEKIMCTHRSSQLQETYFSQALRTAANLQIRDAKELTGWHFLKPNL